jgi:hypothetical protein
MFSMGIVVLLAACGQSDFETAPPRLAHVARRTPLPPAANLPALSPAALRVSQIATRNGDRDYLLLDKARGKIFVFEDGGLTFGSAALTGEYPVDELAPDAIGKTSAQLAGLKNKVTPAGRYTVSRAADHLYGPILDINEIRGKDWGIAIHRLWLGAPAEHREARLYSAREDDKHITYGCIDVDWPTMQQILKRVPDATVTPLYVVPQDEGLITQFFEHRNAEEKTASASR